MAKYTAIYICNHHDRISDDGINFEPNSYPNLLKRVVEKDGYRLLACACDICVEEADDSTVGRILSRAD